ncbi:MAG TPA: response regulator, partial [Ktedonobacteraceae bacterium]|nr:response regulator [Ktedonobacteraceae bacterium]
MMSAAVSSSTEHNGGHSRVLIVDDHEIFRHGLRDLINSIEGFQVVAEANSCRDALAQAQERHIDLVMLDMYLPD